MGKVVVVTSGKGGVGKTTSTAALGAALARVGQKVVVVDFDVGLRNLDLVMGAERRVVHDLINVVQGVVKLAPALIRDKRVETLFLLPASQTRDKDALTEEGVGRVIAELRGMFDWVICDSPAGIERGATLAMRYADAAVIVANAEVSSVRDSDRIIGLLDSKPEGDPGGGQQAHRGPRERPGHGRSWCEVLDARRQYRDTQSRRQGADVADKLSCAPTRQNCGTRGLRVNKGQMMRGVDAAAGSLAIPIWLVGADGYPAGSKGVARRVPRRAGFMCSSATSANAALSMIARQR